MEAIEKYKYELIELIWSKIPKALKGYAIKGRVELLTMISETRNEYDEYETPYPEVIDGSWSDCYQEGTSVNEACKTLLPGILTLLNGTASVM